MALADRTEELDRTQSRVWDVVVIGSGYGAGVCAARLAEAGASVCVLERGREFSLSAGTPFPSSLEALRSDVQIDGGPFRRDHRLGLFNFHVSTDLDVLVGCGLGGTSLINANVSIKPDARVFSQRAWPSRIRMEAAEGRLDPYFERARKVLGPVEYPASWKTPRKLATMEANGGERCTINVHFGPESKNSVGVEQRPCTNCGDCVTGCNVGSKKTLCYTYLPLAKAFGAKIFVQCDVDHIEQRDGRYEVYYQRLVTGKEPVNANEKLVARAVIVGAGVMGSTGILLRSRELGLPISDELGGRVSGNGDGLAFAYNCDATLDSVGRGAAADSERPTGATVLGIIDHRRVANVEEGIIIEEGAFPSAMTSLLHGLVCGIAGYSGAETQHGFAHWFHERIAEERDLFGNPQDGALNRTLLFLLCGHDGADGMIELDPKRRPTVKWELLRKRRVVGAENDLARAMATRLGGMFVSDPLDTPLFLNNLITVHPLGGCPMGDDSSSGVVDAAGRVFSDDGTIHRGLYVADGSVVPTSLGVNPLLTITALAERIAEQVTRDLGLEPRASAVLPDSVQIKP
jgi:cholesterol oxidase